MGAKRKDKWNWDEKNGWWYILIDTGRRGIATFYINESGNSTLKPYTLWWDTTYLGDFASPEIASKAIPTRIRQIANIFASRINNLPAARHKRYRDNKFAKRIRKEMVAQGTLSLLEMH